MTQSNHEQQNRQPVLPDVLAPGLRIVFCGTAASTISAREGAYYANPTNYFWRTLHQVGLIPQALKPQQFRQMLYYRLGLTDIAKAAQGQDATLQSADFDAAALHHNMERYQPGVLAFTSKRGASEYLQRPTRHIDYGLQSERIQLTRLWVLTSPSGAARRYWNAAIWQQLADFAWTL